MTEPTRQISPDGAYWWDGQAWRPMPSPSAEAPLQQAQLDAARPSWLPEGTVIPDQMSASTTPAAVETVNDASAYAHAEPVPSPQWMAPQPSGARRSPIILAAAAALVLIVAGGGVYAFQSLSRQSNDTSGGTPLATSTPPSSNPSQSSVPPVALPLTAELGGEYCPVAHPNDAACWKGSLLNTGPVIRKLALIFVVGADTTIGSRITRTALYPAFTPPPVAMWMPPTIRWFAAALRQEVGSTCTWEEM